MTKETLTLSSKDSQAISKLRSKLNGKKILHLGSLAAWPYTLACEMRRLGLDSENVIHAYRDVDSLDRKLPFDRCLYKAKDNILIKSIRILFFLLKAPSNYSIIHYHSSNILPRELHLFLEGPLFKLLGIPMILSLGGGDARLVYITKRYNPYFFRKWYLRDPINRWRWFSWSKFIDLCATEQELAKIATIFMDQVVLMRQPVDMKRIIPSVSFLRGSRLTIMHVPTQPWKKGSDIILNTLNLLKSEGFEFNIIYEHNIHQARFYELLSSADIYIDELFCGAHGVTAVESMAAGNITCTYIRDDLIELYPEDIPVINVNPDTLYDKLKELFLLSPASIQELKAKSREYSIKYHCSTRVSCDLIHEYNSLLGA